MPLSSLVVTTEPLQTATVAKQLADLQGVTVTDTVDGRMVVLTDTADHKHNQSVWNQIERLPGVRKVDLIYSNFEDLSNHPEKAQ